FVEFCGPGLYNLTWATRVTVANMAHENGATVEFFPFDDETARYLNLSGRSPDLRAKAERYMEIQHLWRRSQAPEPVFAD
ncbi:aconitase family protein, partial [Pseudomonas syringae pv. tagetis]|uniref:aconitase family protein n=1 Tax=Pseudomonas syringae group genomosp. 7 TaxID=251699 RepID=UPI00376F88C8